MINISPRRRHPVVVLLLGLLMFAMLSAPALAANDPADDNRPAIALRLSPAVLEVAHGSGPSRHEMRVDNLGSQPLTIVTQLSDFTVTEDGTTQFLGPQEISATAWASLDVDTFQLAPGERRDVTLTVEVPDDAEPGERYLSAIFTVPGDPTGGNISVTHRVAVKLYIAVPGARIEHLELGKLSGPRLIDAGPATFDLTVHNRGNVHRRFEEGTRLLATSGDSDVAFENFTVLGNSTRVVDAVWPDPPLFCWCTIEVAVDDGRGNLLAVSTRVIAFPLRLSLALFTLTVGLAILAAGRRRRRRARMNQQLDAARGERTVTAPIPSPRPRRLATPVAPPTRQQQPATPSPQPTPAEPSAPLAPAPTATILKPSPSEPPTSQPQLLNQTLFTAHGNQSPQRRRRPRRER